jgi:hypothetical protein
MKAKNKTEDNSSVIKDYLMGILFLLIPIIIIYLVVNYL